MTLSRYLADQGVSTRPRVAVGATQWESPNLDGPDDEIVSAVRLCKLVIELSSRVKERLVKVLLDSGAIGNFISDAMATILKLKITEDADFQNLTLAEGSKVWTAGHVQFTINCGGYKGKIVARVFPNLSKQCNLRMHWSVQENPIIDWKRRQVTIQRSGLIITLPVVRIRQVKPIIETVNLCSAKQVAQWFRGRKVDQTYLRLIRLVMDEKEQKTVSVVSKKIAVGCDVEKAFQLDVMWRKH